MEKISNFFLVSQANHNPNLNNIKEDPKVLLQLEQKTAEE